MNNEDEFQRLYAENESLKRELASAQMFRVSKSFPCNY